MNTAQNGNKTKLLHKTIWVGSQHYLRKPKTIN